MWRRWASILVFALAILGITIRQTRKLRLRLLASQTPRRLFQPAGGFFCRPNGRGTIACRSYRPFAQIAFGCDNFSPWNHFDPAGYKAVRQCSGTWTELIEISGHPKSRVMVFHTIPHHVLAPTSQPASISSTPPRELPNFL